jgi:hypothetical protein
MNEVQIDLSQGPDSLKRKFVGAYILGGSPERLRQCVKINIVPNVGLLFTTKKRNFMRVMSSMLFTMVILCEWVESYERF